MRVVIRAECKAPSFGLWLALLCVCACVRASGAMTYDEIYRPQFHFTAAKNWLNDPNGLVFYKGEYHLFFQHNPRGINWGNMTWGHAISTDLLHWRQFPDAIEPDNLGTIFSGSAAVDWNNTTGFQVGGEKTLVAMYTAAGKPFTQCLAYSNDRGRTWTKYDHNPVLPNIVGENRDPKIVWHAPSRRWIVALYKEKNDYALFESPDMKNWTHLQDVTMAGCGECPDFFPMTVEGLPSEERWVFTAANAQYLVGTFDGKHFIPEGGPQRVEWGKNCYAVQTYSDIPKADGRRIQIAWMSGGKYPGMPFNQQMSFPCELRLRRDGQVHRLERTPVREVERLRAARHRWSELMLGSGENPLSDVSGELMEVIGEFELSGNAEFGIRVRGEPVTYSTRDNRLTALGASAPLHPDRGRIRLHLLVDRTSLEAFGNNGEVSLSSCFLPRAENRGLELFCRGGNVKAVSLEVYELRSAWSEPDSSR